MEKILNYIKVEEYNDLYHSMYVRKDNNITNRIYFVYNTNAALLGWVKESWTKDKMERVLLKEEELKEFKKYINIESFINYDYMDSNIDDEEISNFLGFDYRTEFNKIKLLREETMEENNG